MAKTVAIGIQSFEKLREGNYFYIDKTDFIREWWENGDAVTLIDRPRRFGKTLNMSMVEAFFSVDYARRSELFKGLSIWNDEKYRTLQGTYPVIFLSFANIKEADFATTRKKICQVITELYARYQFVMDGDALTENDRAILSESEYRDGRCRCFHVRSLSGKIFETVLWEKCHHHIR